MLLSRPKFKTKKGAGARLRRLPRLGTDEEGLDLPSAGGWGFHVGMIRSLINIRRAEAAV